jgi:hypothetical protein
MYDAYGFSVTDVVANTVGAVLYTGQHLAFDRQVVRMTFSYSQSRTSEEYPGFFRGSQLGQIFTDYNSQTYWLSINPWKGGRKWYNLLDLAFGHGAEGMLREFRNPEWVGDYPRYRQWYLSFDVAFSRIPTNRKGLKALFRALDMVKVPAPTLAYASKEGWTFKPLFF